MSEQSGGGKIRRIDGGDEQATILEVTKPDGEATVTFTPALDETQFSELLPVVEMSHNQVELKNDVAWLARRWHRKVAIKPR
jgi:hypothetical protein